MFEQYVINSETQLRKIIPNYPSVMDKRIKTELDAVSLEIIEHSSLLVLAYSPKYISQDDNILGGGDNGINIIAANKLELLSNKQIAISVDESYGLCGEPLRLSLYFLIAGMGHGLRINGDAHRHGGRYVLDVDYLYLHCARAAVRAELWPQLATVDPVSVKKRQELSMGECLDRASYALLKTSCAQAKLELSPRGDKPGFIQRLDDSTLFIPERPGNKVAVSLRNVLSNPYIQLLIIIPGSDRLLRVSAAAEISTAPSLLQNSSVNSKPAKLGLLLRYCTFEWVYSADLEALKAKLYREGIPKPQLRSFAKAFNEHISGTGLKAKLTEVVVAGVIKKDMRSLY
ncbi:pyridoxamine 5'-phosphate oxidase family protein [uncultured Pseudoteredinibacter sp.]|uniref:pyridoxamine 5'-phosphate oxidase family protein n=1 Tax=uncultured Pseudoteredinibacter sp. TaxID=1641701 RepID=UPI002621ACB5|nr:pyridoxamine 5'-phosphate oxidase family protein [uncultured Pseudoteredinibacter sp.]